MLCGRLPVTWCTPWSSGRLRSSVSCVNFRNLLWNPEPNAVFYFMYFFIFITFLTQILVCLPHISCEENCCQILLHRFVSYLMNKRTKCMLLHNYYFCHLYKVNDCKIKTPVIVSCHATIFKVCTLYVSFQPMLHVLFPICRLAQVHVIAPPTDWV